MAKSDESAEREAILQGLLEAHEAFEAAREKYEASVQATRERLYGLLEQGARLGLGRKAMSKAAGMSLPSLRRFMEGQESP